MTTEYRPEGVQTSMDGNDSQNITDNCQKEQLSTTQKTLKRLREAGIKFGITEEYIGKPKNRNII